MDKIRGRGKTGGSAIGEEGAEERTR